MAHRPIECACGCYSVSNNSLRGVVIALLLSVPCWALIVALVYLAVR